MCYFISKLIGRSKRFKVHYMGVLTLQSNLFRLPFGPTKTIEKAGKQEQVYMHLLIIIIV